MKAELISLNYQVPQCETSLRNFPVTIGRAGDAGIRLDDRSISNYHCRIEEMDGQLMVCDLGTVHGTCVNSCFVTEAVLKDGDILAIGLLSFLVQFHKTEKRNIRPLREAVNTQQHDFAASGTVAT